MEEMTVKKSTDPMTGKSRHQMGWLSVFLICTTL